MIPLLRLSQWGSRFNVDTVVKHFSLLVSLFQNLTSSGVVSREILKIRLLSSAQESVFAGHIGNPVADVSSRDKNLLWCGNAHIDKKSRGETVGTFSSVLFTFIS